ncbi:sensor domain-containing diguanylate cyclase [Lysinibacillus antri]|uniref:GGDEF domain-containing protein n=1 Tax=Lysinibacillus antri TaxID=2498145 RepID=A0A432LAK9_9BACI|nr:sensor domain-containing diguanylate cyclase [Lysinibacillus antri]RUL51301.1 GGDEF domain-containing protein [Lysinibacillus antri]
MKKGIKLNVVISLLLVFVVVVATVANLVYATNALRTSLTTNYLENNHNYTNKLAEGLEYVIDDMQQSITTIAKLASFPDFEQKDLDIFYQSELEHFNSIFVTDINGMIKLISPKIIHFDNGQIVQAGTVIETDIMKKALSTKKPFISEPYISAVGKLLMLVTAPIYNKNGVFEGVVAGTIYLEDKNIINHLLSTHEYQDGSYVYAVDKDGKVIYHPDPEKIQTDFSDRPAVKIVSKGISGYKEITTPEGIENFAGFSYIEDLGWGVVSLTPKSNLNRPLFNLVIKILAQSATILMIVLILATILVKRLTKPLTTLAQFSENPSANKEHQNSFNISSNIYEINQLTRQIRRQFVQMNKEIQLDGLTGLANRKSFDVKIKKWMERNDAFALVMLDIDNFKAINDTYGHIVGDEVIKYLANSIMKFATMDDLVFRYGGEEFGILMKGKTETDALHVAELIRENIAITDSPTGMPITISLGISSYQGSEVHPNAIIERADKALYQSKEKGKNQTTIYQEEYITKI